jgi:CheY-like chemotaxis protein
MIRKILLAEDDPLDAELTIQTLRSVPLGNEIKHFKDGFELIQYLFRNSPYEDIPYEDPLLIILDLKMPRIDGLEALEIIRSNPQFKHIPVVMLTSSDQHTDILKSYGLGVNAFVVKPVDMNDFGKAVKSLGFFWAIINKMEPVDYISHNLVHSE